MAGVESSRNVNASSARDDVVDMIRNRVSEVFKPQDSLLPEATLASLLGSKASPYCDGPVSSAEFSEELVSLPACGGRCSLLHAIDGEDKLDLDNFESK